jgi:hypothetical protein
MLNEQNRLLEQQRSVHSDADRFAAFRDDKIREMVAAETRREQERDQKREDDKEERRLDRLKEIRIAAIYAQEKEAERKFRADEGEKARVEAALARESAERIARLEQQNLLAIAKLEAAEKADARKQEMRMLAQPQLQQFGYSPLYPQMQSSQQLQHPSRSSQPHNQS